MSDNMPKIRGITRKNGRIGSGPGVLETLKRGLTIQIDSTDWKATVNGTRNCSVDGCDRDGPLTRTLCKTHYARLRRHGDVGTSAIKTHRYDGASCSECDRVAVALGLCMPHWKRMKRHGSPTASRHIMTEDERFLPNVKLGTIPAGRPGLGECWQWTGTQGHNGYGYVSTPNRGVHRLAHRVSHERYIGPIPDGMVVDHLCRNRLCVRPEHLEAVTNEENLRRGLGYRLRNGMSSTCINGHDYTPENTYINPNNPSDIRCRQCARARDRKRAA